MPAAGKKASDGSRVLCLFHPYVEPEIVLSIKGGLEMITQPIRLSASTRGDRNQTIWQVSEAVSNSGGYILDHQIFSNISICFRFELPARNIDRLHAALALPDLRLSIESERLISIWSNEKEELELESQGTAIAGSLQITFIHDDPDLRITIPAIPG